LVERIEAIIALGFEKSLIKSLSQITQQQANSSGCQSRDLCPD
jgi:hypothetical protein